MNTANLQLEGLYLAIAAINGKLVERGILSREDVDGALRVAEQLAVGDDRAMENLRAAERDAIAFPIRLLLLANAHSADGTMPSFPELARMVGATKEPHNDQR